MACCVMAMLVSILGLWANKNTFINRNDTSGEMHDSLDARDISLRLEDQGVHNFHFPAHLQYCQGEALASTQFYGVGTQECSLVPMHLVGVSPPILFRNGVPS